MALQIFGGGSSGSGGGASSDLTVVKHGATAATARPSNNGGVLWIGSVNPTNAVTNDLYLSTADGSLSRYTGSAFAAASATVPALLGATGGLKHFGDRVPLQRNTVTQNNGPTPAATSNGTDTTFNSITRHEFVGGLISDAVVVHVNSRTTPLTITAALTTPIGGDTFYPLTWRGASSVVVPPLGYVTSDPVWPADQVNDRLFPAPTTLPFVRPGPTATNTHVKVRTFGTVTSGDRWDLGYSLGLTGEAYESGVGLADKTLSGTVATPAVGTAMFGPGVVLTTQRLHQPVVALLGDSIIAGYGDTPVNNGFAQRALASAATPVPYLQMGIGGLRAPALATSQLDLRRKVAHMLIGCSHAIYEYGINNLRNGQTLLAIQQLLWQDWTMLNDLGIKVYQTTITPQSTSTDAWATTANQTTATFNSIRTALNAWIRTAPAPLAGYIEVADTVESARDSGIWKANYTTDGVHPTAAAHTAMAAQVVPSTFTVL